MRVLVTRPQHSAALTAKRLQDLGHEPVLLPLTRALHHAPALAAALAQPHAGLVVTSAEALRVLSQEPAIADHTLANPLYAVGAATARAAAMLGFKDVRVGPGDGEGLAKRIATDFSPAGAPLLYLAGTPRSPHLEAALAAAGISLEVAEVYRMVEILYGSDALAAIVGERAPDTVLLYSAESARLFFKGPARHIPRLDRLQILIISASLMAQIPEAYRENLRVAQTPDEDGLFALL